MSFTNPFTPNLTDYQTFLTNEGFTAAVLPPDSEWITWSFNRAVTTAKASCIPGALMSEYVMAVYSLATHHLVLSAQDQPGLSFFANLKAKLNTSGFVGGVVRGSGDQGTYSEVVVSKLFENLRITDLEYIKTIWGRMYLSYAQKYGSVVTVMV